MWSIYDAGHKLWKTKSLPVLMCLTDQSRERKISIGWSTRCSQSSSVSWRQKAIPLRNSSSPFICFYLRPPVLTLVIGVHNPLLFLQLQPQLRRRRLFSRWFIFQGKPFLSPTLMSCPQLASAHFSITITASSFYFLFAAPLFTVWMCLPAFTDPVSALSESKNEAPSVTQNGFSGVDCLIGHLLEGDSFPRLSVSPLPWMLGWSGMQLYG